MNDKELVVLTFSIGNSLLGMLTVYHTHRGQPLKNSMV